MPGRHWVIIQNILSREYKYMRWMNERWWDKTPTYMNTYYTAGEQNNPQWKQIGIYESEEEAIEALKKL